MEQVVFLQITNIVATQLTERSKHENIPIGSLGFDTGKTYIDNETGITERIIDYFEFVEYPKDVLALITQLVKKNEDRPPI